MTVIRPNSVSGINSITVQSGNSLAVHKANGELIRTIAGATGVSTFSSVSVGSGYTDNSAAKSINIGVGASIAQHNDNSLTFGTNGDPRITIDASGDFNVGSAATIKAGGNATFSGIVTAASFIGDGSGLTGAGPTLTGSTNNTIVTVTGANAIQGESNLTFDGTTLGLTGNQTVSGTVQVAGNSNFGAAAASPSPSALTVKMATNKHIGFSPSQSEVGDVPALVAFQDNGSLNSIGFRGTDLRFAAGSAERLRIDSSGRILQGSSTGRNTALMAAQPTYQLEGVGSNASNFGIFCNSNASAAGAIVFGKTRGSAVGGTTVVNSGDSLGHIAFEGSDGSAQRVAARITASVDGTPGSSDMPGRLIFLTTPDGSASEAERMRIHSGGQVSIGNASYTGTNHDYQLVVTPNISDNSKAGLGLLIDGEHGTSGGASADSISLRVKNTNTWNNATKQYAGYFEVGQQLLQPQVGVYSQATGLYSTQRCYEAVLNKNLAAVTDGIAYYSNVVPTNSGGAVYHFFGQDNGSTKIYIEQDGDIKNANNSYGSTSDLKLKENIVDANSQWDDIKGLRIRNFNFKDDPDKVKMLGVVAQEAETVSAGLIDTKNDVEVDESTGEGTITGTTKYVKYSILYMKAVKALQEAQTRIETLETKVAALEGG